MSIKSYRFNYYPVNLNLPLLISWFNITNFHSFNIAEVKFDAGSASLAKTWLDVKGGLPHDKIPSDPDEIKDAGSWGMDYAIVCF